MSQADRHWANGAEEMSSIHAALRQQQQEFAGREADAAPAPVEAAMQLVPLADVGSAGLEQAGEGGWDTAIRLVEAAAARIKAYERKFKAIELDARAFIDRVDAEQRRMSSHIKALEADLRKAEDRALVAEAEVQAMKLETWETRISHRSVERKLSEAEMEVRTSQKYLGQIEGILRSL